MYFLLSHILHYTKRDSYYSLFKDAYKNLAEKYKARYKFSYEHHTQYFLTKRHLSNSSQVHLSVARRARQVHPVLPKIVPVDPREISKPR